MERLITANGVDLCIETFGDATDPALLLIHGASASMIYWETEFCEQLAAGGRFVIRYDHRDTGHSVSYPAGAPAYTGGDLVADAVGVLEALGIERAHLVGISMGGGIAQQIALDRPERVASLTLIATSPIGPPEDRELPPMSEELKASFAEDAPQPDWSDGEAALDALIEDERRYAGSLPYDEPERRAFLERMIDRTSDLAAAMTNHWMLEQGAPPRRSLAELTTPTLVHGGPAAPLRPRRGAGARDSRRAAGRLGASRPRAAPAGMGPRHRRDPRAHVVGFPPAARRVGREAAIPPRHLWNGGHRRRARPSAGRKASYT